MKKYVALLLCIMMIFQSALPWNIFRALGEMETLSDIKPTVTMTLSPKAPPEPTVTPTVTPPEPTVTPTEAPSDPTTTPTEATADPTATPTEAPSDPTATPAEATADPTATPTEAPSDPTATPTEATSDPTVTPTVTPSDPTATPTKATADPTATPTEATVEPTVAPTAEPTVTPETNPTIVPTEEPTATATPAPLQVALNADTSFTYANTKVGVTLTIAGGVAPYTIDWKATLDGSQLAQYQNADVNKASYHIEYMPAVYGSHTVLATVTDANGAQTTVSAELIVAEHENESEATWSESVASVTMTGDWREDLVAVAETQIGYCQSEKDFVLGGDGSRHAYNRYGAWCGNAYADDCSAAFVSFCANFAGIPDFPKTDQISTIMEDMNGVLETGSEYMPSCGDVVFFNSGDAKIGIVSQASDTMMDVIFLGADGYVKKGEWEIHSSQVDSFANMEKLMIRAGKIEATEEPMVEPTAEPTVEPTAEPTVEPTTEPIATSDNILGNEEGEKFPVADENGMSAGAELLPPMSDLFAVNLLAGGETGGTTTNGDPLDFRNYITDASLEQKVNNSWTSVPDGEAVTSNDIRFRIDYNLPGGVLSATDQITYQLPNQINLYTSSEGIVRDSTGAPVGNYTIAQNGQIDITFLDKYVTGNRDHNQAISGYIYLSAQSNNIDTTNNETTLSFGNGTADVHFKVQKPSETSGQINVTKSATSVNKETGEVEYKIMITALCNTSTTVKLTDVMNNINLVDGTMRVEPSIDNFQYVKTSNGFNVELPAMQENQTYTLTYKGKLSSMDFPYNVDAENSVNVQSEKEGGGELTGNGYVKTTFEPTYISKTGEYNKDTNEVTWKITINEGNHNLNGWTLQDTFNDVPLDGKEVNLVDESGKSTTVTLPYTFTSDDRHIYTITYTTPADKPIGGNQPKNKAELKKDGQTASSGDIGVPVGDYDYFNPVGKTVESHTINPDGTVTITWRITINPQASGIKAPWYFTDTLLQDKTSQYFTSEQYNALKNNVAAAFSGSGLTYTWEEVKQNEQLIGYRLNFSTDLPKGTNMITFTYQSTGSLRGGNQAIDFQNMASINDRSPQYGTYNYTPTVRKYDWGQTDGSDTAHNYYDEVMNKNGTMKWGIELSVPNGYNGGDITVKEKLPAGIELKKLTLMNPNKNELGELMPGSTSSVVCPYDKNTYTVTTQQSGQEVIITIPEALVKHGCFNKTIIYVEGQIKSDYAWPTDDQGKFVESFRNEVYVHSNDGSIDGVDSQTQTITYTDNRPLLTKGRTDSDSDEVVEYSVIVNPSGKDLLKDSDDLTLVDSAKVSNYKEFTLSLVPGSVKAFKMNPDGSKGARIPDTLLSYSLREYMGVDSSSGNTHLEYSLRIAIPDRTPLIVEYQYKVNTPNDYTYISIQNDAELMGVAEGNKSNEVSTGFNIIHSGAGAEISGLNFMKVDAEYFSVALKDAQFKLYKWTVADAGGAYQPVTDSEHPDGIYTSNYYGLLPLPDLEYNTAYYLQEVAAPTDYKLNPEPFYFYIKNSDQTKYPLLMPPNGEFTGEGYSGGSTIYLPNQNDNTKLRVLKRWLTNDGTDITKDTTGSIEFELWRRATTGEPAGGGSLDDTVTVTWKAFWENNENQAFADNMEVPIGRSVTVFIELTENNPNNPVHDTVDVTVNGKTEKMTRVKSEGNMVRLEYTFTVSGNSNLELWVGTRNTQSGDWYLYPHGIKVHDAAAPDPGPTTGVEERCGVYTLSSANDWELYIDHLAKTGVTENNETVYYTYFAKELPSGSTMSYTNNAGILTGTITITNTVPDTPPTIDVAVQKKWLDENNGTLVNGLPTSITVRLYQQVGTGNIEPTDQTRELRADTGWHDVFRGLPTLQGNTVITYYVKEEGTLPSGFELSYESPVTANGLTVGLPNHEGIVNITNKKTTPNPEYTSLTITKEWIGYTPAQNESVTIKLHRKANDVEDMSYTHDAIVLNAEYNWSVTINDLLANDGNGNAYTYYVEEEAVPDGFKVSYDTGSGAKDAPVSDAIPNGTITVTNTKKETTSITVCKVWDGASEGEKTPITVQLYRCVAHGSQGAQIDPMTDAKYTITLNEGNNWAYTFSDLPTQTPDTHDPITYFVREVGGPSGFEVSYSLLNPTPDMENTTIVPEKASDNSDVAEMQNGGTVIITNRKLPTYTLPKTGGRGATILYTAGSLLLMAAAVTLLYRKRKNRKEDYRFS